MTTSFDLRGSAASGSGENKHGPGCRRERKTAVKNQQRKRKKKERKRKRRKKSTKKEKEKKKNLHHDSEPEKVTNVPFTICFCSGWEARGALGMSTKRKESLLRQLSIHVSRSRESVLRGKLGYAMEIYYFNS